MSGTLTETGKMNEMNEKMPAGERLHRAIFVVPVLTAVVAALPAVVVLLMVHAVTVLLDQVVHRQIRLFGNDFYIFVLLPSILFGVAVLIITLAANWKSLKHGRAKWWQRHRRLRTTEMKGLNVEQRAS